MPGRDRAGGPGPQVGEVTVVEQHRLGRTGLLTEHDHDPGRDRQAPRGVVVEARRDLHHEGLRTLLVTVLDARIAARLVEDQVADRRDHGLPCRVGHEGLLHGRDRVDLARYREDLVSLQNTGHDWFLFDGESPRNFARSAQFDKPCGEITEGRSVGEGPPLGMHDRARSPSAGR